MCGAHPGAQPGDDAIFGTGAFFGHLNNKKNRTCEKRSGA